MSTILVFGTNNCPLFSFKTCFFQQKHYLVPNRDGRVAQLENVYIRGSKIRFFVLPDMLKNAPMFKKLQGKTGGAGSRGKSAILRAQGKTTLSLWDMETINIKKSR